jgi:class 3 adenylate cyclase
LLNSKELLEKTGISRATLNNYISWGIVPKPEVLAPGPQEGDAPRLGYFPDETVERIADIQRLKKEGWGMKQISERFAKPQAAPAPTVPSATRPAPAPAPTPAVDQAPAVSALATPESPARDAVRKRPPPVLTPVAILVTDLQHAVRIWSELPPEEYFELINHIWLTADPIFKRHHGTYGKHAGDGFVCHFFPRADSNYLWNVLAAALEMRDAIRRVSKQWQLRKGWPTELYMNTGLNEGQEWLGSLTTASQLDLTALGKTITQATRVSEFARGGAIWATKNLVTKLAAAERQQLKYGVRRLSHDGQEVFISFLYSTVENLVDLSAGGGAKLKEIARLPITEIVEITADGKRH